MTRRPGPGDTDPRHEREDGAVLALVLVFLTVTAVLLGVTLGLVAVNLKTTSVVQSRTDRSYTTDAAVEQAIQRIVADPTICISLNPENLPSQTLNDRTATSTCKVTPGGFPVGGNGWAAIITGNLHKQSGGKSNVNGPVYVRGTITGQGGEIIDDGGSVYQYSAATPCPLTAPSASVLVVKPTPPYSWQCTTLATPDPAHVLPPVPAAPKAPVTNGNCRTFFPGKYTSAPTLLSNNYFVSGTYYFEDIGQWSTAGSIVGGYNPDDPSPLAACVANPKTTDATPGGHGGGYGVQWIFGGDSSLNLSSQDEVLLHTRSPGPDESGATPGISFQTVTAAGGGYKLKPANTSVLDASGGQPAFTSYGLIYARDSNVSLVGPVGESVLRNGIVAHDVSIKISNSDSGSTVIGLGTSGTARRYVEITATATSSGEADVVSRAVVEIRNTTNPPTVVVRSWRTTSESP